MHGFMKHYLDSSVAEGSRIHQGEALGAPSVQICRSSSGFSAFADVGAVASSKPWQ